MLEAALYFTGESPASHPENSTAGPSLVPLRNVAPHELPSLKHWAGKPSHPSPEERHPRGIASGRSDVLPMCITNVSSDGIFLPSFILSKTFVQKSEKGKEKVGKNWPPCPSKSPSEQTACSTYPASPETPAWLCHQSITLFPQLKYVAHSFRFCLRRFPYVLMDA